MPRILHLEDDEGIRDRFRKAVSGCHEVISCRTVEEALKVQGEVSLYVCGPLGKHSDGLLFALERSEEGASVVVLSEKHKFSKVSFLPTSLLSDSEELLRGLEVIMAEG